MLIVAGYLLLDQDDRDAHVTASSESVRLARDAAGCFDFAVSADLVDPRRVNVFERWAHPDDLAAFRASPSDPDAPAVNFDVIREFVIEEFSVAD